MPAGVDPKSVLCEFFKHGQCTKGFKCKYSHDLNIERKTAKVDLFTDRREGGEDEEGMEDWDQDKLEKVVNQKHGAEAAGPTTNRTNIICKFFLDAVEKRQYGWFWQCPNGNKECKYRHALPPGYVLKSQMAELVAAEAASAPSVEESIEAERAKVDAKTPVTEAVFAAWRARGAKVKEAADAEKAAARRAKGTLTGREVFGLEGFVAEDDAGAAGGYERERDEEAEIAAVAAAATAAEADARVAAAAGAGASAQPSAAALAEAEDLFDDEGSDEDLDALEAALSKTAVA